MNEILQPWQLLLARRVNLFSRTFQPMKQVCWIPSSCAISTDLSQRYWSAPFGTKHSALTISAHRAQSYEIKRLRCENLVSRNS